MKLAVTGGSGFIGSALVERLEEEGHDVLSLDVRTPFGSKGHQAFAATAFAFDGCEAVHHLAGPLAADVWRSPSASLDLQLRGTVSVLEAALET